MDAFSRTICLGVRARARPGGYRVTSCLHPALFRAQNASAHLQSRFVMIMIMDGKFCSNSRFIGLKSMNQLVEH